MYDTFAFILWNGFDRGIVTRSGLLDPVPLRVIL
jgi:hypothetical protein